MMMMIRAFEFSVLFWLRTLEQLYFFFYIRYILGGGQLLLSISGGVPLLTVVREIQNTDCDIRYRKEKKKNFLNYAVHLGLQGLINTSKCWLKLRTKTLLLG